MNDNAPERNTELAKKARHLKEPNFKYLTIVTDLKTGKTFEIRFKTWERLQKVIVERNDLIFNKIVEL